MPDADDAPPHMLSAHPSSPAAAAGRSQHPTAPRLHGARPSASLRQGFGTLVLAQLTHRAT